MLDANRAGEERRIPPRTKRLFQQGNYWYYATREGVNIGPFDSEDCARKGVNEFLLFMNYYGPSFQALLSNYRAA